MLNSILILMSVFVLFGMVLAWFTLFGEKGLIAWTVIATITANIEVLIMVDAFGISQTLGNVLFASTFLVTDILSEIYGKKSANRAVNIGILTSITFIIISQSWLFFQPNGDDLHFSSIQDIFSNTPRLMIVSLLVYAVVQKLDVWLYHMLWKFTQEKLGDKSKFLWLRNNASTLISQLFNTVLFTFGAFYKVFDSNTLVSVALMSYIIFIVTSISDTPFVYLARHIYVKKSTSHS